MHVYGALLWRNPISECDRSFDCLAAYDAAIFALLQQIIWHPVWSSVGQNDLGVCEFILFKCGLISVSENVVCLSP